MYSRYDLQAASQRLSYSLDTENNMISDLPSDMSVVRKEVVVPYQNDRTILAVTLENDDFGVRVTYELHQGEPRERTSVFLLELLSANTADTGEPVILPSTYRESILRAVSDWVEENQSISYDYREF